MLSTRLIRAGTLIPLHLTHEELSNLIGTARETVTIQLHKFEEVEEA